MRLRLIATFPAALLAACAATAPNTGAPRAVDGSVLVGDSALLADLAARDVRVREGRGGMDVEARIANTHEHTVRLQWRVEWLDKNGFLLHDPGATFRRADLENGGAIDVKATAPSPLAVRVQIRVERPSDVHE